MTAGADLLGKVFISHSWKDKRFARRLAERLAREGFGTWLDEHEMRPGDRIAETIAGVLAKCKAVIVVVSSASARSRWLAYEVSLATQRMIAGRCRIIPVVIGDAVPPPGVRDILYADFRRSFRAGLSAVMTSLKHDAEKLAAAAQKRAARHREQRPSPLDQVFGHRGWASRLSDDTNGRKHWNVVYLPVKDEDNLAHTAMIDYVHEDIYDLLEPKPLRDGWWADYVHETEYIDEPLRLVISERTPEMPELERRGKNNHIWYRRFDSPFIGRDHVHVVFADISNIDDAKKQVAILRAARRELVAIAHSFSVSA